MKIIILLICLILAEVNCLKSNDVCNIVQIECTGKYDLNQNYKEECGKMKCNGKYGYQCSSTKCTIDQKACKMLNNSIFALMSFKIFKTHNHQLNKYQELIKRIKNCPTKDYQFHLRDVCTNVLFCTNWPRLQQIVASNSKDETQCPCGGNLSYHCAKYYCTKNKKACELFQSQFINRINLNDLKSCNNEFTKLYKSFLLF